MWLQSTCGFLQVPTSVCSSNCLEGHAQVIVGVHHCCFECVPCEAGTFLNKSGEWRSKWAHDLELLGSVQMKGLPLGHMCAEPGPRSLCCQLGAGWKIPATSLNSDKAERNNQLKASDLAVSFIRELQTQLLQMQSYPKFNLFIQTDVAIIPFVPSHAVCMKSLYCPCQRQPAPRTAWPECR